MVSGHGDMIIPLPKLKALVGVGAIADHISQMPDLAHPTLALNISQHGGEGSQIGVDIGQNCVTHHKNYSSFGPI